MSWEKGFLRVSVVFWGWFKGSEGAPKGSHDCFRKLQGVFGEILEVYAVLFLVYSRGISGD